MNVVEITTEPTKLERRSGADPSAAAVDGPRTAGGGDLELPAAGRAHRGLAERLRLAVWAPVAAKSVAVLAGMIGLAAIGSTDILGGDGTLVSAGEEPAEAETAVASLGGVWLKPTRSRSASGSPSPQPHEATSPARNLPARRPSPQRDVARAGSRVVPAVGLTHPHGDEPKAPPAGVTRDGRVILNTASAVELTRLPGVGEKRAAAIVRLRDRLKRFRRASDLLRVRGIGVRTLKKMMPHLVVDPPEEDAPDEHSEADRGS